jgi:hypothetical protein
MRLLQQLRPQGRLITSVVQDPGDRLTPVGRDDWRHIVRFGRNVASYKFPRVDQLAHTLTPSLPAHELSSGT